MFDAAGRFTSGLLVAAVVAFAASPTLAQTTCTGRWRVAIETTSGTCQPNEHSRAIQVMENGQIALETPSNEFDLSGNVAACKTVSLVITRRAEVAAGSGQITGDQASGTWTVTKPPSRKCSGTWFARQH
jgi:hypothetical protein